MKCVTVAKSVRVIVTNDGQPLISDANLQLHGKTLNQFAAAKERAAKAPLIRRQLDEPITPGRLRFPPWIPPGG
jgi:hypothetical protein